MKKIFIGLLVLLSKFNSYAQTYPDLEKIIASDITLSDNFGVSVSVSGNWAIVGTPYKYEEYRGYAYLYHFDGLKWIEKQKIHAPFPYPTNNQFGRSVSISGNTALIGVQSTSTNGFFDHGAAYVFRYNGNDWVLTDELTADDKDTSDFFGSSVAIDGNHIIIGAKQDDDDIIGFDAGSVYFFEFDGYDWNQISHLTAFDGTVNQKFGSAVAIDGNFAIVGKETDNDNGGNSGAAYMYEYNGTNWNLIDKIKPFDGQTTDKFGHSVAISGQKLIVGAFQDDDTGSDEGSAYIFEYDGLNWLQTAKIIENIPGSIAATFGMSVSIDGNKIIVGAPYADDVGNNSGRAYIYEFNGTNWIKTMILIPSAGNSGDEFGMNVFVSDNKFICAAAQDDEIDLNAGAIYYVDVPQGIVGNIYNDLNSNCIMDANEFNIPNRHAVINPGNIIIEIDSTNHWFVDSLAPGNYTITVDTSGNWIPTCTSTQNFTVIHPDSLTLVPSIGLISTSPCALPNVSVNAPFLRRCFSNQKIYIQASNEYIATGNLVNAYVDLELNSLITPTSSSLPYNYLGNNIYRFILTNTSLSPGENENFWINTSISCNAVLGQSLCIEANLYPADSCVFDTIPADPTPDFTPCGLSFDHSSISVDGWCDNDSIYFIITNNGQFGTGDMQCYSPIRLYIDGQYIWLDSIQLLGGETDTLVFSGDGRTWRLEVDQHPLHPGNSHPNSTIELCGNDSNWTSGMVNILPLDDADPIVDIYCGVVTGSYDPNDKTGYPLGVTDSHYVSPNGKLEYVIRFQNTGTDTAFTVVVRDTLDLDLNIFSVISGVSSHNYSFRMYGPRILEWTFNNILLPDSTTDEPGSNGFVSFEVNQIPNLPDGTEINNEVGIYFDFNAPIITNTTSHIIHRDIYSPSWTQQLNIIDTTCFNYSYNNLNYSNTGEYLQINEDTLITLNIFISSPIVDAGQNMSVCEGELVILNGSGANNYNWDNGVVDGISFNATVSQMYHVIGTDIHDCQNSDSLFIFVYDTIPQVDFIYSFNNFEINLEDSSSIDVNNFYWTIDGDSLSNQNTAQYLFTQNGSYEICLIASNDCFSDTTCQQIEITTIGINDLNSTTGFKIYPNPTHSNFTIEISELNNSPFEITDITGKIIYTGVLKDKLTNVDLSNVANGIYLLKMEEQSFKIIKQ